MKTEEFLKKQDMYGSGVFDCPETKKDIIEFAENYANLRVIEELEKINNFDDLGELADYTFWKIKELKQ